MKKKLQKLSIKKQFLLIALITYTLFICYTFSFILQTREAFRTSNKNYTDEIVNQLQDNIKANYSFLTNIIYYLSFQTEIQDFLIEQDPAQRYALYSKVKNSLANVMSLNTHIEDFILVDSLGNSYSPFDTRIPDSLETPETLTLTTVTPSTEDPYFIMSTPIKSTNIMHSTNQTIGTLYMKVDKSGFCAEPSAKYTNSQTKLFVFDADNNCFWKNNPMDPQDISEYNAKSKHTIYLENPGFSIVALYEQESAFASLYTINYTYILLLLFILFLVILLWSWFIHHMVRPLQQLAAVISDIKDGVLKDLSRRIYLHSYAEATLISEQFNGMLFTIDTLTRQVFTTTTQLYEAKIAKEQAELQYLRSQINPHFLYNTLETLKGMAAETGQTAILKMSKSLASIFKYSVKGSAEVPLSEELNMIKSYVYIQHLRFADRFLIEYRIDPSTLSVKIPKMILQPLVENAIVHGIEGSDVTAQLRISAWLQDHLLNIEIYNQGIPIAPEKLKEIQQQLQNNTRNLPISTSNHIGISNVDSRLKIIYGNDFGLQISSDADGTFVSIKLPAEPLSSV